MTVERAKELIGKEGVVFIKGLGTCTIAYVDYDDTVLVKYVINSLKHTKWCRLDELEEIEETTKRPCTREELVEMLKKQGLPMLLAEKTMVIYTVIHIDTDIVNVISYVDDSPISYGYESLCEQFTLLNGDELWIKE